MFWSYGYNGWMMLEMVLWSVLWLALLGLLIWGCVRWLGNRFVHTHTHPPISEPSALEILRQRYARGEIDADTFERMKERLEGTMEQSAEHV